MTTYQHFRRTREHAAAWLPTVSAWALLLLGLLWGLLSGLLVACGGGSQSGVPAKPPGEFTAEHALLFESGVDFIADPEALEGRWRDDWSTELAGRVSYADVIALVQVDTFRTDVDPARRNTYRLVADVAKTWMGEAPDELVLVVRPGDTGFGTVHNKEDQIINKGFVAFIRWDLDENGRVVPRWHLSPASSPVAERVMYLVGRREEAAGEGPDKTVVVHE